MKEKRTLNILLADDDEDDRMIFTEIVTQMDEVVNLRTVSDGQQLLQLLSDGALLPDVIFLDLNMPNKNGKECLKEIKTNPALGHLPVIIYSTSAAEKDIRDTYNEGASLYIQKPSNIRGLKKTLTKVLSIDWLQGHSPVDKEDFLVKLSWLDHILPAGTNRVQHYFTDRPIPLPAFSIVWPKSQPLLPL
jgi:CheY-like chemotaxis protein